jgi:hypothetical protein
VSGEEEPRKLTGAEKWVFGGCAVMLGIAAVAAAVLIVIYLLFLWYVGPDFPRK